jgi:hypothetical protein
MKLRFGAALLLFSLSVFLPSVKSVKASSCNTNSDCSNSTDGNCPLTTIATCCDMGGGPFCLVYCPGDLPPVCNNN